MQWVKRLGPELANNFVVIEKIIGHAVKYPLRRVIG